MPLRQDLAMIAVPNMQSLVILWKQEKAGGTSGREFFFHTLHGDVRFLYDCSINFFVEQKLG